MWPQVLVLMAEGLCCSPGRCTWSWQVLVAVITLPVEWLRDQVAHTEDDKRLPAELYSSLLACGLQIVCHAILCFFSAVLIL
uniref:Uncharacterized protein n=1 Tax=Setaria viridis TaxID=4556 RepID=A0A4U6V0Y1_SETVI|nr:hypothetical protein SEVIR_4G161701v2 [Setaria viridis]